MVSEEQHMALPRLYGAPAYSRPARPTEVLARPFDPDELPLEADRTEEDLALANELAGATWAPSVAPPAKKGRRGRAAKQAVVPAAVSTAVPAGATQAGASAPEGESGLQGRPFSLRGLGRIFNSDRK